MMMTEFLPVAERPADRFTLHADQCHLLLIDLQERLIPAMPNGSQIVQRVQIMIEIAAAMGIPIILTEQYPEGLGPTTPDLHFTSLPFKIRKISFSAATPEVLAKLEAVGRRQVIVCGVETHVCVFQTVRQLLDAGYRVFVIEDGVCSRSEANKQNGLQLIWQMGAIVTNLETVLFDLLKQAGTPLFKQLSRLIR
jgi:nicotinamidase-related amidase